MATLALPLPITRVSLLDALVCPAAGPSRLLGRAQLDPFDTFTRETSEQLAAGGHKLSQKSKVIAYFCLKAT
eukprot:783259-Pleurochrysis_carterae.AAC.3